MSKRRSRGEGTLVFDSQRKLWVGRVPASLDSKRRAVYGKTQSTARERLHRAVRDAERGLVGLADTSCTADYLDRWLHVIRSRVESGALAPSTAAGYERDVRRFLGPLVGRVPLRKLTPAQVEEAFGTMIRNGYAPKTVQHVRGTLSRALSDAQRDQLVERNVARLVDPPRVDRRFPSAFTAAEFAAITRACAKDRLGRLFMFAAFTGLRRSEVLGLTWGDVDLERQTFRVREGVHQISAVAAGVTGHTGLVRSRPKTEASGNELPLSRQAVSLLREQRRAQAVERLSSSVPWPNDDPTPIFSTSLGTPLQPSNVSRAWRRVLTVAGVPSRTDDGRARGMHELRRTFATRLRDQGIPLEDVQRLGRWASSKMLLEVYSASGPERLRSAADAVGRALANSSDL